MTISETRKEIKDELLSGGGKMKDWRNISARAWTAWFRQTGCGLTNDTPSNRACAEIFNSMPESEKNLLKSFMLSDTQIPQRFSFETGIPVERILSVVDAAGKRLIKELFGFED